MSTPPLPRPRVPHIMAKQWLGRTVTGTFYFTADDGSDPIVFLPSLRHRLYAWLRNAILR